MFAISFRCIRRRYSMLYDTCLSEQAGRRALRHSRVTYRTVSALHLAPRRT